MLESHDPHSSRQKQKQPNQVEGALRHILPEPEGRTTDAEGASVERRLEADVAQVVVIVEVIIHCPVRLGEILLDLACARASSSSLLW